MADTANMRTLKSSTDIVNDIERRIVIKEFDLGEKLPAERSLCTYYGVSRSVIREALRSLNERGLIEIRPSRGSFVRIPREFDLTSSLARLAQRVGVTPRQIVDARVMLESNAAASAACAAEAEIAEIAEALEDHQGAKTVWRSALTDLKFHESIIHTAGNPLTEIMYGSIRPFVLAMMLRSHSDKPVQNLGDPLHEIIYQEIKNGDSQRAKEVMRKHLTLALDVYGEDLDKPIEVVLERWGIEYAMIENVLFTGDRDNTIDKA